MKKFPLKNWYPIIIFQIMFCIYWVFIIAKFNYFVDFMIIFGMGYFSHYYIVDREK